jgi:hypothetical protein
VLGGRRSKLEEWFKNWLNLNPWSRVLKKTWGTMCSDHVLGTMFLCITRLVLFFLLRNQLTGPRTCILKHFEVIFRLYPTALQLCFELSKQRYELSLNSRVLAMQTSKWTTAIKSQSILSNAYPASQRAGAAVVNLLHLSITVTNVPIRNR